MFWKGRFGNEWAPGPPSVFSALPRSQSTSHGNCSICLGVGVHSQAAEPHFSTHASNLMFLNSAPRLSSAICPPLPFNTDQLVPLSPVNRGKQCALKGNSFCVAWEIWGWHLRALSVSPASLCPWPAKWVWLSQAFVTLSSDRSPFLYL